MSTDVQPLALAMSAALGVASIYPSNHPRIDEAAVKVVSELEKLLRDRKASEVTLLFVDQELVVDGRPMRTIATQIRPMLRWLSSRGVQRLSLAAGLKREECRALIEGLVGRGELASSEHLTLGRLLLGTGDGAGDGLPAEPVAPLSDLDVDAAEAAFHAFRVGGSIEDLDRIVWRFMDGLARSTPPLLLLRPIKEAGEAAFVHALNVGLLTVVQARSLGIGGAVLHDLGVAGMLHDIGYTVLGNERRSGARRLDDEEWGRARRHPELGAALLAGTEGVPPLAVQVAYEHHLRWDGGPSFPESARGRRPRAPSFASQLVAVADTFDTMISSRGLVGVAAREAAFRVWRVRAGTWLDPFLVGNFVLLLTTAAETAPGTPDPFATS